MTLQYIYIYIISKNMQGLTYFVQSAIVDDHSVSLIQF